MRHRLLVLIREPILQDKSGMEGDVGIERGRKEKRGKERGTAGCYLSRAWGQPIRQKGK